MLETVQVRKERFDNAVTVVAALLRESFGAKSLKIATSQYEAAKGESRLTWGKIVACLEET